jgi:GAF domain-containing protein
MESDKAHVNLKHIALQMTSSLDLNEVLTTISQGLVDELGAAFARIWLLGPGDLCNDCFNASSCLNREICLHLEASAGMYTNLNGEFRRVPLGVAPIGRIALNKEPIFSEDLVDDIRFPNREWIKMNEFCCYAGYPLIFRDELLGATAIFGRHKMSHGDFDHIAGFANQAAIAIKNAQLFGEVAKLRKPVAG